MNERDLQAVRLELMAVADTVYLATYEEGG